MGRNNTASVLGFGQQLLGQVAALPHALSELEAADGQRLVSLTSIDPTRQKRLQIMDPAVAPPKHWPGRDSASKS